jgi:hypothetical protein
MTIATSHINISTFPAFVFKVYQGMKFLSMLNTYFLQLFFIIIRVYRLHFSYYRYKIQIVRILDIE